MWKFFYPSKMSKCPKLFEWQVDSWLAHESDKNCFISFSSRLIFHRLSLDSQVDLKKLRYFTIAHSDGSTFAYPVDREIVEAQRKVRSVLHWPASLKSYCSLCCQESWNWSIGMFSRWCSVLRPISGWKSRKCNFQGCNTASRSGTHTWVSPTRREMYVRHMNIKQKTVHRGDGC